MSSRLVCSTDDEMCARDPHLIKMPLELVPVYTRLMFQYQVSSIWPNVPK
jgi:hypothetical protein